MSVTGGLVSGRLVAASDPHPESKAHRFESGLHQPAARLGTGPRNPPNQNFARCFRYDARNDRSVVSCPRSATGREAREDVEIGSDSSGVTRF